MLVKNMTKKPIAKLTKVVDVMRYPASVRKFLKMVRRFMVSTYYKRQNRSFKFAGVVPKIFKNNVTVTTLASAPLRVSAPYLF